MMMYTGHPEEWGLIPAFLNQHDERDAVTQIDASYEHGGGWHDTVTEYVLDGSDEAPYTLLFAVDPHLPYVELGRTHLRDETVVLFAHGWVAVVQPDGSSRVARID